MHSMTLHWSSIKLCSVQLNTASIKENGCQTCFLLYFRVFSFFVVIILILTNIRITFGFYYHLRLQDVQKSAYTKCSSGGVSDPQVYCVTSVQCCWKFTGSQYISLPRLNLLCLNVFNVQQIAFIMHRFTESCRIMVQCKYTNWTGP